MGYKKWFIFSLILVVAVAVSARAGYYYRDYQITKDIKQQKEALDVVESGKKIKGESFIGKISAIDNGSIAIIPENNDESASQPVNLNLDQNTIILKRVNVMPQPFVQEISDLLNKMDNTVIADDRRALFEQYQVLLDKKDEEIKLEQERLEKSLPILKNADPIAYVQAQQKIDSITFGYTLLEAKPEELAIDQKVLVKHQDNKILSLEIFLY